MRYGIRFEVQKHSILLISLIEDRRETIFTRVKQLIQLVLLQRIRKSQS